MTNSINKTIVSEYSLAVAGDSHEGRSGKNNEDSWLTFEVEVRDDFRLASAVVAVVADGIGGNNAGERASRIAVEKVRSVMSLNDTIPVPERLEQAVIEANQDVFDASLNDVSAQSMGTTIVAAAIFDDKLFVVHAGDSRAYLIRGDAIHLLTIDHTWAQEAIEAGRITPEAARSHPNRNVIRRYLGISETVEIDSEIVDIEQIAGTEDKPFGSKPTKQFLNLLPGDRILLCSDGLNDELGDQEILDIVLKHYPLGKAVNRLIAAANAKGGRDNITVILLRTPSKAVTPATNPLRIRSLSDLNKKLILTAGSVLLGVFLTLLAVSLIRDSVPSTAEPIPEMSPVVAVVPDDTTTSTPTAIPTSVPFATNTMTPSGSNFLPTTAPTDEEASPTLPPTSTPVSRTPTATTQPSPTISQPRRTRTPVPRQSVTATPKLPEVPSIWVTLQEPNDGDGGSVQEFSWRIEGELRDNQAFEIVFWKDGLQDPLNPTEVYGLAQATRKNSDIVDLDQVEWDLKPGEYLWSVRLIQIDPYKVLKLLSDGRRFLYTRTTCVGIC